jgi:hypothetical protein
VDRVSGKEDNHPRNSGVIIVKSTVFVSALGQWQRGRTGGLLLVLTLKKVVYVGY